MNIKRVTLFLGLVFLPINAYMPMRYSLYIDQMIADLTEKSKKVEKKMQAIKSNLLYASKKEQERKSTLFSGQVATIVQGNKSLLAVLENRHQAIKKRLVSLEKEKASLKSLYIKDEAEEAALIKAIQKKQRVAELNNEIDEVVRIKTFFEEHKVGKTPDQIKGINTVLRRWSDKEELLRRRLRLV